MCDYVGLKLFEKKASSPMFSINTLDYPQGLYVLHLRNMFDKNNDEVYKIFIKQY